MKRALLSHVLKWNRVKNVTSVETLLTVRQHLFLSVPINFEVSGEVSLNLRATDDQFFDHGLNKNYRIILGYMTRIGI